MIEKLKQSDSIEIFGTGFCLSIARQTAFKLNTIGLSCAAFDGINEHYVVSNRQKKRKMVVLLTFTGINPYMLQTAKYLKQYGYDVLGIGGGKASELKEICHYFIELSTKETILSLEALNAAAAMTYVLDIIFIALLTDHYEQHLQTSIEILENQ